MHIAPRRHAWHTSCPGIVKGHCSLAQAIKVRSVGPIAAVVRQKMPIQRIEHNHERLHWLILLNLGWVQFFITDFIVERYSKNPSQSL